MILVCIQLTVPAGQSVTSVTEKYQRFMFVDGAIDSLLPFLGFGGP